MVELQLREMLFNETTKRGNEEASEYEKSLVIQIVCDNRVFCEFFI